MTKGSSGPPPAQSLPKHLSDGERFGSISTLPAGRLNQGVPQPLFGGSSFLYDRTSVSKHWMFVRRRGRVLEIGGLSAGETPSSGVRRRSLALRPRTAVAEAMVWTCCERCVSACAGLGLGSRARCSWVVGENGLAGEGHPRLGTRSRTGSSIIGLMRSPYQIQSDWVWTRDC